MPTINVTLPTVGNNDLNPQSLNISRNRLNTLLSAKNKDEATAMGLWDRFKDLFRTNKKKEVLSNLYDFITNEQPIKNTCVTECDLGCVSLFNKLKECANEAHQDLFKTEYDTNKNEISFFIESKKIKTVPTLEVLRSISVGGENLLGNYSRILIKHCREGSGGLLSKQSILGADDFRKISKTFFSNNPELESFLKNCGITQDDVFDRIYDLLGEEVLSDGEDSAVRRQVSFTSLCNHLT